MRAWLRRNRIGIGGVLLSMPLLAVVLIVVPLSDQGGQEVVRTVSPGGSGVVGGLRYRVLAAAEYGPEQQVTTPAGTVLVAAAVEVQPMREGASARSCTFQLSASSTDGRARWDTMSPSVTRGYGYVRGEGYAELCDAAATSTYRAETLFLAPAGTAARATLDIRVPDGIRQQVLRLRLPDPPPEQQGAG